MKIKKFAEFIGESEIPFSEKAYVLRYQDEGTFSLKGNGVFKEFNVVPIPENFSALEKLGIEMKDSLAKKEYSVAFKNMLECFKFKFDFSRIYPTKVTLESLGETVSDLSYYQRELVKNSPVTFLEEELPSLPREVKEPIVKYVTDNVSLMLALIEAVKHYVKVSTDEFYEGMNSVKIMQKYTERIEELRKSGIKVEGPFGGTEEKTDGHSSWKITGEKSTYTLVAPNTPAAIRADNEVSHTKGLNFSIVDEKGKVVSSPFPIEELVSTVSSLI